MMDRSIELIATIIAVLKAGAAYVPIDPLTPNERLEFIINDCHASMLITKGKSELGKCRFINIDIEEMTNGLEIEANSEYKNLPDINSSKDLVYMIYTSGSTGNQKGLWSKIGE